MNINIQFMMDILTSASFTLVFAFLCIYIYIYNKHYWMQPEHKLLLGVRKSSSLLILGKRLSNNRKGDMEF